MELESLELNMGISTYGLMCKKVFSHIVLIILIIMMAHTTVFALYLAISLLTVVLSSGVSIYDFSALVGVELWFKISILIYVILGIGFAMRILSHAYVSYEDY